MIGFGRIGQLVAKRAQGFEMEVVAFDKFVSAERFRELGVEGAETLEDLLGARRHRHPARAEDAGDDRPDRRRGDRRDEGRRAARQLRPRRAGRPRRAARRASSRGKLAGAALDVFPAEPFTEHPIFARDDVVVTPHLGASTAEAQDRAGVVTAEQVTAALTGGVVTNAVNIAAVRPEEMEALAPFVPLCEKLGRLAQGLGDGSVDRVTRRVPRPDRLPRHPPARDRRPGRDPLRPHRGAGQPRQRAADGRGAGDRAGRDQGRRRRGLHRAGHGPDRAPATAAVEVAGTGVGPRNEPYLVSVWGESFYLPFAEHLAVFRYADQPGMIGRVGTMFGEEGVNIVSAAVGAEAGGESAVMALTTDAPVREETIEKILELDGFSRRPLGGPLGDRLASMKARGADRDRGARGPRRSQERPDPAGRPRRGADRGQGRRDQLRRHDGPRRPLPGRAEAALRARLRGRRRGRVGGRGGRATRKVGDRVIAGTRFGGQAELVTVPASQVLPLPERLSFEQGAAFPVNYGTAYAALVVMGGLREGDRVLIHAAAGGVGIAATQIARNAAPRSSAPPRRPSTTRSASRASSTRSTTAPGLRGRGDADHRRRGSRPDHRRARPDLVPQGLPAAAPGRAAGDVRALGGRPRKAGATSRRR